MRRRTLAAPLLLLAVALLARHRLRARREGRPLTAPARPGAQVTALPAPPRFLSIPWTLVAAPEERPELTVRFDCSPDLEPDRVDAQETPTQVFVTVIARHRTPGEAPAAAHAEREATISLSAPLGARELVHAAVDADAPGGEPPL